MPGHGNHLLAGKLYAEWSSCRAQHTSAAKHVMGRSLRHRLLFGAVVSELLGYNPQSLLDAIRAAVEPARSASWLEC